jgi:hypothetical protein
MIEWILILVFSNIAGMTSQNIDGFHSQNECVIAGQTAMKEMHMKAKHNVQFVCIQKTSIPNINVNFNDKKKVK